MSPCRTSATNFAVNIRKNWNYLANLLPLSDHVVCMYVSIYLSGESIHVPPSLSTNGSK